MDRRNRKTKKALYEALIDLMASKDISKISITELTKKADINRKTFYYHYETFSDFVDEIVEGVSIQLTIGIKEALRKNEPFDSKSFLYHLNTIIKDKRQFYERLVESSIFSVIKNKMSQILYKSLRECYSEVNLDMTENELHYKSIFASTGVNELILSCISEDDYNQSELNNALDSIINGIFYKN